MSILKIISLIICIAALSTNIFLVIVGKTNRAKIILNITTLIIWVCLYIINLERLPLFFIITMPIFWIIYVILLIKDYKLTRDTNEIIEEMASKDKHQ